MLPRDFTLPTPEQMARMPAAEFAELEAIIEHELLEKEKLDLENDFAAFLQEAWRYIDPAPYVHNWHIDAICEHLEAVCWGDIHRIGICVPPRSAKSSIVSVAFCAWVWAQRDIGPISGPQVQFMYASYSQRLANKLSVATLRLILSPWYQKRWGDRFALLSENMEKFENDKGGYRLATSAGGVATGEGGICLIIDDPLNADDANSQRERDNVLRWWDESMPTRLNDQINGAKIIIAQRLHEDDICGHIMGKQDGEHWDWLVIPMRYDPDYDEFRTTALGWHDPRTKRGQLMWEERWPEDVVRALETSLGPYAAAAQLQQVPTPRGGGIVPADWWQIYDEDSAQVECGQVPQYSDDPEAPPILAYPPLSYVIVAVDTAYKESELNDWNACIAFGVWHNLKGWPRVIMLEAWRWRGPLLGERLEGQARIGAEMKAKRLPPGKFPDHFGLTERVLATARRRRADCILIEDKTRGPDLEREIRRLLDPGEMTLRLEVPKGDKVARLHSTVPMFADKMVWRPAKAWADEVVDEVAQFPKGRNDDRVDCVSMALLHLRTSMLVRLGNEADDDERERARFRPQRGSDLYDV